MRRLVLPALAALVALPGMAQATLQRFALPGGLPVALREDPARVLFRARLQVELRPGDIPAGQEGLVQLTLRMMDLGLAGHLKPAAFDRALDEAGIQITRHVSSRAITWDVVGRNRDQDRALGLLADRILRPILDPGILETERLACWRETSETLASPDHALQVALGLAGPADPTDASLGRLDFASLEAFRQRVFRPGRAVLLLEGDLGLEQAKALALLAFGTWSAPTAPEPAAAPGPAAGPPTPRAPAALPGGLPRAELAVPAPPDLPPAVRDLALLRLAGDPALADVWLPPAAEATLRFRAFPAPGGSAREALAALQARIAAVLRQGVSASDLARARTAWAGARQVRGLHPAEQLDWDTLGVLGGTARPEEVAAVTPEQVQAALGRWLAPAALRVVLVGAPTP